MILSLFVSRQGKVGFVFVAVSTILRDLALVSLIFFFIWHNGESVGVLGWRSRNLVRNIILGFLLYVPLFFLIGLVEQLLQEAGFSQPPMPAPSFFDIAGRWETVLAVVLVVIVAIAEETIFRGYLYLRFRTVTASPTAAVLLSAFVFSLGHGYEGSLGMVTVGIMGVVFNLVYLWTGSLVAPMILHFLQDFIAIVLVH